MTATESHLGTPAPAPGPVFVGRERERAQIGSWLLDPYAVPVLAVVGPGGLGKTTLLRHALRDRAAQWVDLSEAESTVPDWVPGIVVLDDWDRHAANRRVVTDRLLDVPAGTRVVLAGRNDPVAVLPLGVGAEVLRLGPLALPSREEWAEQCGIADPVRRRVLAQSVGGHPLTLGLAIDLLRRRPDLDHRTIRHSPEWGLVLTTVVERLLGGIDPQLHAPLLAAALVQRLDEPLLAAMLAGEPGAGCFDDLMALSVMRPVRGGLAIREEVRRAFADHQQWRRPDHVRLLQARALAELDRRTLTATPTRAKQLASELVYVVRHGFDYSRMPNEDEEEGLRFVLRPAEDLAGLLAATPVDPASHLSVAERAAVDEMLSVAGAFANVALGADETVRGFGVIVPLCRANLAPLPAGSRLRHGARAMAAALELDDLPETLEQTNMWSYTVGTAPPDDAPVIAGLFWVLMEFLDRRGSHLLFPTPSAHRQFGDGYEFGPVKLRLIDVAPDVLGEAESARFYDLSRSSRAVELASAFQGTDTAQLAPRAALADEVTATVDRWTDDGHLARTSIARALMPTPLDDPPATAALVRSTLAAALHATAPVPSLMWRLGRALEEAGITWLPQGHSETVPAVPLPRTTVRLQGGFDVRRDGRSLLLGEGVPAAVVKVVAWHQKLDTEELIEHLWPGVDAETGRTRLRAALARVRKIVPDLVVREGDTVRLVPDATVDAVAFRVAARRAVTALGAADRNGRDLAHAALREYAGELLPSDRAADWAAGPRADHTSNVLRLLDALATDLLTDDVETAADLSEQAIGLDPYDEARYLRIVEALVRSGLPMRARRIAERGVAAAAELALPAHPRLQSLVTAPSR